MESRLCSVIIPAYNCEKYIEDTINSVINQTYRDIEILIVNDCSTDGTEEIIMRYLEKDNRIRYIKNEKNLGVSGTRNKAIKEAKGYWLAFVDSDDYWELDKLEKQITMMEDKGVFFSYTGAEFISNEGKRLNHVIKVRDKVDYETLLYTNMIVCSSVVIRKDLMVSFPSLEQDIHEDYIVWLTILKSHDFAYGLNEPLVKYRLAKKSKSRNKIKASLMTYRVYKYMGIDGIKTIKYMVSYMIRGLLKYGKHIF